VFLQDPVAQVSYTLNLTDRSAQKMPMNFAPGVPNLSVAGAQVMLEPKTNQSVVGAPVPPPLAAGGPDMIAIQKLNIADDPSSTTTEDLGSQTVDGVVVVGTRTTHVIASGQIGNDRPIRVVTEVWTSPALKTIVSSKRSDPRMGVQTFKLTNIALTEPDASLFTVPADFRVIDGPQPIIFRTNP
jgi:hypothetical protein